MAERNLGLSRAVSETILMAWGHYGRTLKNAKRRAEYTIKVGTHSDGQQLARSSLLVFFFSPSQPSHTRFVVGPVSTANRDDDGRRRPLIVHLSSFVSHIVSHPCMCAWA